MNDLQKAQYKEKYLRAKRNGEKFFPDSLYRDMLVMFAIFLLLVGLAAFVGVAAEPKADPSDTAYIPRPEWYFLFLFEMLKFFPGSLEWVGTTVIPVAAVFALLLLPFYDKNPARHWKKRKFAIGFMSVVVAAMVFLTIRAVVTTPAQENAGAVATTLPAQISAGQDIYSVQCAECHGAEGEGGVIKGVKGLEGYKMKAINSQDEMYTRMDDTLYNIVEYGQPDLGMPPFGKAFGGELSRSDIDNLVTFMRYTWDNRVEVPKGAAQTNAIPALGPNDIPSYDVNIAPIVKRYCVSCHRPGKENNNYYMGSYSDLMNSGDHKPNIVAGDLNSNLIRMLHGEKIEAGGAMPPTKALSPDLISIFERWVKAGAPEKPAK
ncbi:MAG: c-type cytochrome [Chloroflexi bacterium]|nr:c-type cytochrome [Chloroflexota bacterium]MCL5273880.1 c-type cytochrome [Chloroflexota bacterium]